MTIDIAFLKKKSANRFTGLISANNPDQLMIVNHSIGPWLHGRHRETIDGRVVRDYESIEEMIIDYKKTGHLDGFKRIQFYPDIKDLENCHKIPLTLINTLLKGARQIRKNS